MEEFELFEELGLSKNESKVYSVLVKFGKLSAGESSSKSGVPYGRIYDVLNSLINKGIVKIIPEKTKKFIPSSPEFLLKLIHDKKDILEKAEEKAKELKEFYSKKEKNPFVVAEGDRGFWKIADEMKEAENYSYSIRWTSKIRPDSLKKYKRQVKKGIDVKTLTRYDEETKKNVDERSKIDKSIRVMENSGFACSIIDDKEVLLGLIKNNTTILIRDEAFAKIMKRMFLSAYNSAEKIN
jgi:sugar-specific transcriptional regulator TrmB